MRCARWLFVAAGVAVLAAGVRAETLEMASLVPADAKAIVETVNAAQLRATLLDSKFWAALDKTEAFRQHEASERHREMEARLERLLADLKMTKEEALRTYLGGRSAVVLLAGEDKRQAVLMTEATNAMAQRLVDATGGVEAKRYRDVAIWEVRRDNRVDRMAFAGGVLLMSGAEGDALERVLDAMMGGAVLGTEGHFAQAAADLPAGWRVRAYAAETKPRGGPGAVAMYPKSNGRLHFEWRLVSGAGEVGPNEPTALESPKILPAETLAAVATAFRPKALWDLAKAKAAESEKGPERLRRAEMGIRGWFPGQTMETITSGFGPEAAIAITKNESGKAPALLGLVRLTASGRAVAQAFKDGLAAKAMILAAFTEEREGTPKIDVQEETYGGASILVIKAPGFLEKVLGDAADNIAVSVAVTDTWLVAGTTTASVKKSLDAMSGGGESLAAEMQKAGDPVPSEPVTRWGVLRPAQGADVLLDWAERLAGRERIEQAKKMINLAEVMRLVERFTWQRTDEPTVIRGKADVQAIE